MIERFGALFPLGTGPKLSLLIEITVTWDEKKLTTSAVLRTTRVPSTIEFRPEITLFERALNNRIPANTATAIALSHPSWMGCWDTSNNEESTRENNEKIWALHLAWNEEDGTIVQVINDVAQMWKGLTLCLEFPLNLIASFQWGGLDNSYIMNTRPPMQTNKGSRAAPFVATWSFQTLPRAGWHALSSDFYDVRILKVCHL